ncbi:cell wall-binding repeat-containing protein [Rathayibacter sp. VKM Ac-2805]|uniref:cell wall-binding repeat-containing protein n=1 Tax=Rathayibacter sp. VKM Ac-2805 TaxID=2609258 RepID=UPI00131FA7FC|nr:cell wall-binding repeat-containing protein [Rathayibacter sp. VKM Ac-2805]QHC72960.1 hypothetical protein GSU40_04130 [Rathayibacter sp. VKM Ac-2805]
MSPLVLRSAASAVLVAALAITSGPLASAASAAAPSAAPVAAFDAASDAPRSIVLPEGQPLWQPSAESPLPAVPDEAPSAARASAAASISGRVVVEEADGSIATTTPRGALLNVEVWSSEAGLLGNHSVAGDLTFSIDGLTAGQTYYLLIKDNADLYADLWSGGSAVARSAEPLQAPAAGVQLRTARLGSLEGRLSGVAGDQRVDIWYRDPGTDGYFRTGELDLITGGDNPYSFQQVVPGDYLVRASSRDDVIDDSYWDHVLRSGDAGDVRVPVGGSAAGIDLSLSSDYQQYTGRLAGSDRYATSVEATGYFSPGIPVLYVASGANWPDALSAGPAAAALGGALLLTDPDRLPRVVSDEIRRLRPERVVVVGSELSVSPGVLSAIRSIVGGTERIGGTDRYDTSRRIVADAFGTGPYSNMFVATGTNFPDALSAAPIAGWRAQPVLLVDGATSGADSATATAVRDLAPEHVEFLGGDPSIRDAYVADFARRGLAPSVSRIAGRDRYETSVELNSAYPQSLLQDSVFLAAGSSFADALSGATTAAALGSSVLLTERDCVHDSTLRFLASNSKNYAFLLGGEPTLTEDVANLRNCEYDF